MFRTGGMSTFRCVRYETLSLSIVPDLVSPPSFLDPPIRLLVSPPCSSNSSPTLVTAQDACSCSDLSATRPVTLSRDLDYVFRLIVRRSRSGGKKCYPQSHRTFWRQVVRRVVL